MTTFHEDEILAMMGETEEQTAKMPDLEKTVQKARADFAQFEKDLQEPTPLTTDAAGQDIYTLTDLNSGQLLWTNQYEVKKSAVKGFLD